MNDAPLYQDRQVSPIRTWLAAGTFVCISAIPFFANVSMEVKIMLFAVAFVSAFVLYTVLSLDVVVFKDRVRFGLWLIRKTIPAEKLAVGDIETIPFGAGVGIHYYRGKWVYNARFGRGVILESGKSKYLVGSDNPEMLQSALLQIAPRKGMA